MKQISWFWLITGMLFSTCVSADWFEQLKTEATDEQLHQLLYEMPKGGDLHLHMSGAVFAEWWYELALEAEVDGYRYYTKVKINNCRAYGGQAFNTTPYLLLFLTINESSLKKLSECEQGEYIALRDLDEAQKSAWLDSLRLDKPYEGRDEFFEAHWQRLGDLVRNPYLAGDLIQKNFEAYADEGLIYLEPQVSPAGYTQKDGTPINPYEVAEIFRQRLKVQDILETGMSYRFQLAILRFHPQAKEHLKKDRFEVVFHTAHLKHLSFFLTITNDSCGFLLNQVFS